MRGCAAAPKMARRTLGTSRCRPCESSSRHAEVERSQSRAGHRGHRNVPGTRRRSLQIARPVPSAATSHVHAGTWFGVPNAAHVSWTCGWPARQMTRARSQNSLPHAAHVTATTTWHRRHVSSSAGSSAGASPSPSPINQSYGKRGARSYPLGSMARSSSVAYITAWQYSRPRSLTSLRKVPVSAPFSGSSTTSSDLGSCRSSKARRARPSDDVAPRSLR